MDPETRTLTVMVVFAPSVSSHEGMEELGCKVRLMFALKLIKHHEKTENESNGGVMSTIWWILVFMALARIYSLCV